MITLREAVVKMRVSDIQQIIMNLAGEIGKSGSLKLDPGQIVSVLLKEIQGEFALLSFQGKDILAKLETEVPVGEKLQCMVTGEKNGQVVLKVLDQGADTSDIRYKLLMNSIGLEENSANLALTKAMVNQQIPLAPEKVKLLSAFLRTYNIPESEAWIPVLMNDKGMPLTEQNFKAFRDIMGNIEYLKNDLNKLTQELKMVMLNARPDSELRQISEKLTNVIASINILPNDKKDTLQDKLQNVIKIFTLQTDAPSDIKGETVQSADTPLKQQINIQNAVADLIKSTGESVQSFKLSQKAEVILERLAFWLKDSANLSTTDSIPQTLTQIRDFLVKHEAQQSDSDILPLLDKFMVQLKKDGEGSNKEIISLATSVSDKIETVRSFNSSLNSEPTRENVMVFYSNISFSGKNEEPVRIVLNYRNGGKKRNSDFSSCRINVSLNTPKLGYVSCEAQLNYRNLTIQFIASGESAAKKIDIMQEILGKRLQQMGFNVKMLPCQIKSETQDWIIPVEYSSLPGLFQINLMV